MSRAPAGPPVLFADLDGTVRLGWDQLGRWTEGPDDVQLFPEAVARMRYWRSRGGLVIGVTNQAGPALGLMPWEAQRAVEEETVRQAGHLLDQVLTCLHAPDAGCWCRKPEPGLLYAGLEWVAARHGGALPRRSDCLMVGDMDTDREAAERAGIAYLDAAEWRGAQ